MPNQPLYILYNCTTQVVGVAVADEKKEDLVTKPKHTILETTYKEDKQKAFRKEYLTDSAEMQLIDVQCSQTEVYHIYLFIDQ